MRCKTQSLLTLSLGALIGLGAATFVSVNPTARADDRDQRMDQSKWTTGDYARDALDHLKKAEAEMHHVADAEGSKVAKDGCELVVGARAKVDEFVAELDKKHK